MNHREKTILVAGATGQQGGSVANALRADGWHVKALVRDPHGDKAAALAAAGIELIKGDFKDIESIRNAVAGAHGVFSVQPSSGQGAAYGVTDADEVRYGTEIADIAMASGVRHFVYSSANAAGPGKTGVGHFDSKSAIEAHLRGLNMASTIVRPSAFMEILTLPGLGLEQDSLSFFMRADQPMQFIAVEDIGRIVAQVFADPAGYASRTIEIAGDAVTGDGLAEKLSAAVGRRIRYHRFADSLLEQNTFLGKLAELVDSGRLAGSADLVALRQEFRGLSTFDEWLRGAGRDALLAATRAVATDVSLR